MSTTVPPESGSKTISVSALLSIILLIVGATLIALGAYLWFSVDATQPEGKVSERTATTTVRPRTPSGARTTKTRVFATKTTTTTQAPESGRTRRSETLVGTLLVLGALVLLTGAFYSRISELSLPGGGGLKLLPLAPSPATQATIARVIAARPELTDQPEKAEMLYLAALSDAQSKIYDQAITAAAQGTEPPSPTLATPVVEQLTEEKIEKVL
jgi:hypothetical protein